VDLVLRIAGQVVGGRSRGSVEKRCGVFEVDADFIWIFDKKAGPDPARVLSGGVFRAGGAGDHGVVDVPAGEDRITANGR